MKNKFTFTVLVLLSTLIFACKKDTQITGYNNYYFRAQNNSSLWDATQGAYLTPSNNKLDTLTFFGSKGEEHLSVIIYKNSTDQYKLDLTKTKFYTTVGQDAVASSYLLDSTAANKLNFNISTQNQIAAGNFNLSFKKVSGADSFPATVVFTEGEFILPRATGL